MKNPEGFEIVYISDWFFDTLEKEMAKISRVSGDPFDKRPMMALRDLPAMVEFRHLREKEMLQKIEEEIVGIKGDME